MEPSLNLTPHRSPSAVWDEPGAPPSRSLHMAAAATGAAVAMLAWHTAPPRRFWIAGLGAAGAMAALISGGFSGRAERAIAGMAARRRRGASEPLDRTLKDTFPASDSPAVW